MAGGPANDTDGVYLGLLSGTSMDGIDAALIEIAGGRLRVVHGRTCPYPGGITKRLQRLVARPDATHLDTVGELDTALGELFATAALALLDESGVNANEVRGIGSHGQTVRHQPDCRYPFTIQIGDANVIAARTGIDTVADLRRRDMALGGEGAPLAPAFHAAMFGRTDEDRVVANIGGIANITILGADGHVRGFDTGPGNTLMDGWIAQHGGQPYDDGGRWAASGTPDPALLAKLREDDYFTRSPPKSTGRETFNLPWLAGHLMTLPEAPLPVDVQATLCELTASTLTDAIAGHAPGAHVCLVCGGGALNDHLLERLRARLRGLDVRSSASEGLAPEWVEAAGFAWLASRTLAGRTGNVPAVTGASAAAVLGAVYRGRPLG